MSARNILLLTVSVLFLSLVLLFAPSASVKKRNSKLFYAQPLLLRSVSMYAAPLLADKLWLDSNSIGEGLAVGSDTVNAHRSYEAFRTIATLDPYFFHAINYGATFLASVQNRTDLASDVVYSAQRFEPNDFRPYFLRLLIEITYNSQPDYEVVSSISKKLMQMSTFKKQFGIVDVQSFTLNCMAFAASKQGKVEKAKEDLAWLAKNTSDPRKKKLILSQLEQLSSDGH